MARQARLSIAGLPHLIDQRGVQNADLFRDDEDRLRFLDILQQACRAELLALHGYALATRQMRLIATPLRAAAVGRVMQALGRRYVRHYNDRHRRRGALFEARFRSAVLDPEHYLLPCMRFVELGAADDGTGEGPERLHWSSFRHHAGFLHDPMIEDAAGYWALGNTPFERHAAWRTLVAAGAPAAEVAQFEAALRGGWMLGSEEFSAPFRSSAQRRLVRGRPGRPRSLARKPSTKE